MNPFGHGAVDADIELHQHSADGAHSMLLMHGLANAASVWSDFVPRAPRGLSVWSADLPWRADTVAGFNASPRHDRSVDAAKAAICGVPGDKIVVAHSFATILVLAALHRDLAAGADPLDRLPIAGLVLVSPFYRASAAEFDWDVMSHRMNNFHWIMEEGLRVAARGRVSADLLADMGKRVRERVGPYGWMSFFDAYLRTPWLELGAIDVPCLVVTGEQDFAAAPAEAEAVAARLPDARLVTLADCGHFPMAEAPDRFAVALSEFAESIVSPRPAGSGCSCPKPVTAPAAPEPAYPLERT